MHLRCRFGLRMRSVTTEARDQQKIEKRSRKAMPNYYSQFSFFHSIRRCVYCSAIIVNAHKNRRRIEQTVHINSDHKYMRAESSAQLKRYSVIYNNIINDKSRRATCTCILCDKLIPLAWNQVIVNKMSFNTYHVMEQRDGSRTIRRQQIVENLATFVCDGEWSRRECELFDCKRNGWQPQTDADRAQKKAKIINSRKKK